MTIYSLKKLILRIKEALVARTTGGPVLALAQEYAQRCEEAAARLDQCCAMLEKGSDYQALQLAETEPALPEVMAALSFAERLQWVDYCRAQQLPVPLTFEVLKVQAMDAMYGRGITSAHPLYKDYRGAISRRDDVAALRIVRTITRLNPSDSNAQAEQNRLEEKRVRESAAALKIALETGADEKAAQLTAELETLATAKRLEALPEYQRGCAVQQKVAQQRAVEFVRESLTSLPAEQTAGNWQAASAALARVEQACMEHGLPVPQELQPTAREIRAWVMEEEKRSADEYDFRQRLDAAINFAADIEGKLSTGGYKPAEAQERLTALEQCWEAVRRCEKAVPAAGQQRVESAANALRQEVERMRRRKRLGIFTASAAAAAVLAVAGWAGYSYYTAAQYGTQLREMQSSGRVEDAEKVISEMATSQARPTGWAGLEGVVAGAKTWVSGERGKLAVADKALQVLEGGAGKQFPGLTAADLTRQLEGTRTSVAALVAGFRQSVEPRLATVGNAVDARLTAMRSGNVEEAERQLAEVEKLLSSLTMQSPVPELRAALAEAGPLLEKLQAGTSGEADQTSRLPDALTIKLSQVQKAATEHREQITGLDKASDALARAATLEEFTAALNLFSELKLAEVLPARSAALEIPTAANALATILYDDPARRTALANRKSSIILHPAAVLKDDLNTLLAIRDDEYLNEVYVIKLSSAGKTRTVVSTGKPRKEDASEEKPDAIPKYTGKFYTPLAGDSLANFVKGTIPDPPEKVESITLSVTSSFVQSLNLESMTDAAGETYAAELLPVFSRLAQATQVPASARAFIWSGLATIVQRDPAGWGLNLSPSLQEDLRKFQALPKLAQGSSSWMLLGDAQKTAGHAAFFKAIAGRSYSAEAMTTYGVEDKILKAGLRFAGYTDETSTAKLLPDARNATEFWLVDRVQKKCRLLKAGPDGALTAKDVPAFSPLFIIPVDRKQITEQSRAIRSAGLGPFFTEP